MTNSDIYRQIRTVECTVEYKYLLHREDFHTTVRNGDKSHNALCHHGVSVLHIEHMGNLSLPLHIRI